MERERGSHNASKDKHTCVGSSYPPPKAGEYEIKLARRCTPFLGDAVTVHVCALWTWFMFAVVMQVLALLLFDKHVAWLHYVERWCRRHITGPLTVFIMPVHV